MSRKRTAPSPDGRRHLQASAWLAVVRAYQECNRRYTQMLQAFGLTASQFDVLNAIDVLADRAMPKAIAAELLVTRGNVTGILHRLQDRALVQTHAHEHDARSFICALTPAGKRLLWRARDASARFISAQLAPFTDAELRDTENQMRRMRAHLQTIDPAAVAEPGTSPQRDALANEEIKS